MFHQKFGMGTVKRSDGDKLEIAFDKAGEKKLFQGLLGSYEQALANKY